MTVSPELTFVPRKFPHEITSREEGLKILEQITPILRSIVSKYGVVFFAKLDPHHYLELGEQTYCVEVVPNTHLETYWFTDPTEWKVAKKILDELFGGMAKLGLFPVVSTKHWPSSTIKDWPGGGCHLHIGTSFIHGGPDWYRRMEKFHRNLVVDYANRPYIRWLFKQWFADSGGTALISSEVPVAKRTPNQLFVKACGGQSEIEARFMGTSKNSYATYELRMFSMVANPEELRSIVRFANTWLWDLRYVNDSLKITISDSDLHDLKDLRKAKKTIKNYLDSLGLLWDDYATFFERNYVRRVRYGKMI